MTVVGLDVGGTKISAARRDGGRFPLLAGRQPTERSSTRALLDQLEALVRSLGPCDAVGVAVPSIVDAATGAVRFSVNIPLAGVPLRDLLSERLGVPVHVDNDATCAALAEAHDDDGAPRAAVTAMVTVGTGVGGGIVIDGRPFRGATGAAGEIGHMLIAADLADGGPAAGSFPRTDSLEGVAAGRALDRDAVALGHADGSALVTAAEAGDPDARAAVARLGERLGVGIANLVTILDPDLVVVGGGVAEAGALLLDPARATVARLTLPGVGSATRIEPARHGTAAGAFGATLLASGGAGADGAAGAGAAPATGAAAAAGAATATTLASLPAGGPVR